MCVLNHSSPVFFSYSICLKINFQPGTLKFWRLWKPHIWSHKYITDIIWLVTFSPLKMCINLFLNKLHTIKSTSFTRPINLWWSIEPTEADSSALQLFSAAWFHHVTKVNWGVKKWKTIAALKVKNFSGHICINKPMNWLNMQMHWS